MPRPLKCRQIAGIPVNRRFLPELSTGSFVNLTMEELEVIRCIDGNGEDQETAAQFMMISRGTVQRLLQEAHHKIAIALVNGMQIYLQGGNYEVTVRDTAANVLTHDDVTGDSGEQLYPFGYHLLKGAKGMNYVVAVMAQNDQVSQHFGRSAGFYRYEVVDGKIVSDLYVNAGDHQHDGMVSLLLQQGVTVVIVGGIGAHAVERLDMGGIRLIAGVAGSVDAAIRNVAEGTLLSGDPACHGDVVHEHGHSGGCCH